jgi:uncharacterized protein with NRDE domain
MCLAVVLNHVHPKYPVVIAANRDELFARPALPPRASEAIIAGVDTLRGGTWLGATRAGFLAAVTNQRGAAGDPALRSRGELVLSLLRAGALPAAETLVASVDPRAYPPFNLLYGDASVLRVAYGRDTLAVHDVAPGLHILPNDVLDADLPSVSRVRALIEPHLLDPEPFAPLFAALAAVSLEGPTYGTRSTSILALGPDGTLAQYLHADGPPRTTPLQHVIP